MCEPASIGYGLAAIVGGVIASKALAPKIPDAPAEMPAAATPAKPTTVTPPLPPTLTPAQPVKTVATQAAKVANTTKITSGRNANSTMLTGPTGVDLNSAVISKNTLLGQ